MNRFSWGSCRRWPATVAAASLAVVAIAQAPAPGAAGRPAGFTFLYKKGDRTVARFSGEQGRPITATVYEVTGFRVETFNPDGTPHLVGDAPTCTLNITSQNASSSGSLTVSQVGGAFSLRGEGFSWDQDSERLQLSNKVHAVFRLKGGTLALAPAP
ncbi:MAG: hypothetical protein KF791_14155 [Verrucomicrobiae bacterium]|nr:hypothetical protein [Verrucomicrobiae bacterium]